MGYRKNVLISLLLVLLALSVVVVGTLATWSDSVEVKNNSFGAGTMNLQILDPAAGDYTDGPIYAVWGASNIVPGQPCGTATISVAQPPDDTLRGTTVCVNTVNTCSASGMDKYIQITRMFWRNGGTKDVLPTLQNTNATPWIDLDDLENQIVDCLDAPHLGGAATLTMGFMFHRDAPDMYQRQSVVADFTLTLQQ
jgi:predicted ribosomally synthesized peptide with SipW-like signal peptide